MGEPNYDDIRRRVEKRFKARQELQIHFAAYVIVNIMLWIVYLAVFGGFQLPGMADGELQGMNFPAPILVTMGWGIGMIAHLIDYYNKHGGGLERREKAIQREVDRELLRQRSEKPKRDQRLRLAEDGEIEELIDEGSDFSYKERR